MFNFDDESSNALIAQWHAMTTDEKEVAKRWVDQTDEDLRGYWKGKPFTPSQKEYLALSDEWASVKSDKDHSRINFAHEILDDEILDDEIYCLQYELLNVLLSPKAQAWEQAGFYVVNAMEDPIVQGNPVTVALLKEVLATLAIGESFTENRELLPDRIEMGRKLGASERASNAANVLHVETRNIKADVFKWLDVNRANFKSKEKTAAAITKQQPIAHRTALVYVGEWEKLQSASTLQHLLARCTASP